MGNTTNTATILGMTLALAACSPALTPAGPASPSSVAPRTESAVEVSPAMALPDDRQRYMLALHKLLRPRWDKVRTDASALLPATHPANDMTRVTRISVRLDRAGQLKHVRVVGRSGNAPYDNSALGTVARLGRFPALPPSLTRGHVELRWQFHRDARSCSPRHAALVLHPLSPEEAFADAMQASDMQAAYQVLQQHPRRATLLGMLAEQGLRSPDRKIRTLALRLAPLPRMLAQLEHEADVDRWNHVLAVLEQRRAASQILAHLTWLARPVSTVGPAGGAPDASNKISALLQALSRLEVKLPHQVLDSLLDHHTAAVALAAAPMASQTPALDRALSRFASDPRASGPLAVYRLAIGQQATAQAAARAALASDSGRMPTLQALQSVPVPSLAPAVEALVRGDKVNSAARVRAIWALAKMSSGPRPFYVALLSRDQAVRIAAISALGQLKGSSIGICYRLSAVAKERGPVGAEALAAVARLGQARFLPDVNFLSRSLPAALQARVVSDLWGFGEAAVPYLQRQLNSKDRQLRLAAVAALARIPGDRASKLRRRHLQANPVKAAAATPAKQSPLAMLMQKALRLSSQPAPQPKVNSDAPAKVAVSR